MHCDGSELVTIHQVKRAEMSIAQLDGAFEDRLEDRLRIGPRPTNDGQHLGGRGLARQRLGQFTLQVGNAGREHVVSARSPRPLAWLL
jgi:hypothetical protein